MLRLFRIFFNRRAVCLRVCLLGAIVLVRLLATRTYPTPCALFSGEEIVVSDVILYSMISLGVVAMLAWDMWTLMTHWLHLGVEAIMEE